MFMEIFSPHTFLTTLFYGPLARGTLTPPLSISLKDPRTILSALFVIHYANRAIISPARSPPRSKSHVLVVVCAILFNIVNGFLMGAYISSPSAFSFLVSDPSSPVAFSRPSFWIGTGLWAAGFIGNVMHDEILFDIRRKALQKKADDKSDDKPHYGIPNGYLYRFISYPNYFCEWVEWAGFALAASPLPNLSKGLAGFTTASPPWLFFFAELFSMLPRAYRGHQWYHSKFPDYPKERKAVIPFLL